MSLRTFLQQNRAEIDAAIRRACPNLKSINDEDRRQWLLNDEGLYRWARSSGVNL